MNKLTFAVVAFAISFNVLAQPPEIQVPTYTPTTKAFGFVSAEGGTATVTLQVNGEESVVVKSHDGNGTLESNVVQVIGVEGDVPFFAGAEGGTALFVAPEGGGPVAVSTMMMVRTDGGDGESFMMQADGETFAWNPGIADMLNATPQQRNELRNIVQEFRTQRPQGAQGPQAMAQRFGELRSKINQVMRPEQQTKLGELAFQLAGGLDSRFLNERTLDILDLTDAQKEQIRAITASRTAEAANAMREFDLRNATPEERDAFVEKISTASVERSKKYAAQIKAVLTAAQKAKAERLTAEAPALREKLKMPMPGQHGQMSTQSQRARTQQPTYMPGSGSWQPGQPLPETPEPINRRGTFPRGGLVEDKPAE